MAGKALALLDVHMAHLTQYLSACNMPFRAWHLELTLQTLLVISSYSLR